MTQVFDEDGAACPVTVIEAGPCVVVRKKDLARDGYRAVQLGYGEVPEYKLSRPLRGHFRRCGVKPRRTLREVRVATAGELEALEVGQEFKVDIFQAGERVDVIGISKGKGFQGAMKRHGFGGGPASHGSMSHRRPASTGSTDPARVFKGTRKPGHMGDRRTTQIGLKVIKVDPERNLLLVRGSVPGPNRRLVMVRKSVRSKE